MDPLLQLTSADHLNAILEQAGVLDGLRVRNVSIISDHQTLGSRIIRSRLTYDGPANGRPESLIIKTRMAEQHGTEWLNGHREVAFYKDVAPSLPGLVPRCFAADHAGATAPGHLILEDLTETHSLASEWPLPPTAAQCSTIVGSLGRLHAAWWDDPRLGVTVGDAFDDAAMNRFNLQVTSHFAVFADRLGDELSVERRAFYERLIEALPQLFERYRDARNITITHGDAHVWNCFLPLNGGTGARWFDWEGWRIRVPTNDLAYMMGLHWHSERRQRLERALLNHYHTVLQENGVSDYGRSDIWDDYRLSMLWIAVTPLFAAGLKLPPLYWWDNFLRVMAAVDDLECRDLLG